MAFAISEHASVVLRNLLKLGLTQAVEHVGPMNKVKLKFVSEVELGVWREELWF